jgi:hypothetical protein
VVDPIARPVTHLVVKPKHRQGPSRLVPLDFVEVRGIGREHVEAFIDYQLTDRKLRQVGRPPVLVVFKRAEPATELVVALFDRAHPILVEWLCSTERTASTRAAFVEDALKIAGNGRFRDPEPLGERPLGAPHEQGHATIGEEADDLDPTKFGAELPHRVVVTPPARRVDRAVRPTGAILHTHVESLPCTLIAARVEVTADTVKRDGAQLFGFERIELQAGDERLGDDDGRHTPTVFEVAQIAGINPVNSAAVRNDHPQRRRALRSDAATSGSRCR